MAMEIPEGDYSITLEHHPNQPDGVFLAIIADGEHKGRGFALTVRPLRLYDNDDS